LNIGAILFGSVSSSSGATSQSLTAAKIFAFKLYNTNGDLLGDYIPVRVGTVGYLYDRVSGKLFGNAGTGDFVLGPDKARFGLP
jgi:CO dehydrogenase/acetyl-CoA synthase alpha subunit